MITNSLSENCVVRVNKRDKVADGAMMIKIITVFEYPQHTTDSFLLRHGDKDGWKIAFEKKGTPR